MHGLTASGLVLGLCPFTDPLCTNGTYTVAVPANATSFVFPSPVADGTYYRATVQTLPANLNCQLSNGSGQVSGANVTSILLGCISSTWTWVGGGIYGAVGEAFQPSARQQAATWTDAAGNFWLFGGTLGIYTGVFYNDLWQYSPSRSWIPYGPPCKPDGCSTWNTANNVGAYGTQGVAAQSNTPGARANAATWVDSSGNLWLFGGTVYTGSSTGAVDLNDLWMFNPTTGLWTWMGGSDGQTVATGNIPPPVGGAPSAWTDKSGNFWLYENPLWKYSPSSGQWTQVGSAVTNGDPDTGAVYGTQGQAAPGNYPGQRNDATTWIDAQGNVWLFGGGGYECYDDMWEFSPSTGEWTWVSGSNSSNAPLDPFGTLGVPSATTTPGCVAGSAGWADNAGNLWLLGGHEAYEIDGEFWKYNIATGLWTWMGASPPSGTYGPVYGNEGVPSAQNGPGPRAGAAAWVSGGNQLWLFGGASGISGNKDFLPSETPFDDLWVFMP